MMYGIRLADAIAAKIDMRDGADPYRLFSLYREVMRCKRSCGTSMCYGCKHFRKPEKYRWSCGLMEQARELGVEIAE